MGDLNELPRQLAELRELIPEAHAAVKDLTGVLREYRKIMADGVHAARDAAENAATEEMHRFAVHLQKEMNAAAADLNEAVNTARKAITQQLTPRAVTVDADGKVHFTFTGHFDQDVPPETADRKRGA
jgi:F0F1-type ATP synthase membrane subunit b/b'